MSLIRPQLRARLLPISTSLYRQANPGKLRWQSQQQVSSKEAPRDADPADPPATRAGDSDMIRREDAGAALVDHQPDYHTPIDHGTSFPRYLEELWMEVKKEILHPLQCCPAPPSIFKHAQYGMVSTKNRIEVVQSRLFEDRIYKPAKTATQSGDWHGHHWRMDWDLLQKGHRWENPLMGWQSSADYLQGTHLTFNHKEDAIRFAQKQGYEYFVQEPNERKLVPKAYANNFLHSPKRLKKIPTK